MSGVASHVETSNFRTGQKSENLDRAVDEFVNHYNEHRHHSTKVSVALRDRIEGRQEAIHAMRNRKLDTARDEPARRRSELRAVN